MAQEVVEAFGKLNLGNIEIPCRQSCQVQVVSGSTVVKLTNVDAIILSYCTNANDGT